MIALTEQEGSAERAAERGRAEDLGFSTPSSAPSLGDPVVVAALVSEFAQQVVAVRIGYNADKLSDDEAVQKIDDLATEYGKVIMGHDRRYSALPWNHPERLGRRIRLVVPADDGVDDPGRLLFVTIGSSLIDLAIQMENENMSDEAVKGATQSMLRDTAELILGVR